MADRYAASGPSLLLVASDAAREPGAEAALRAAVAGLDVTRCGSLDAARVYLAAAAFDAVLVDEALPGGDSLDAPALRARLGAPVHVLRPGPDGPDALRRALGLAEDASDGDAAGARRLLEEVRLSLGRALHEANNPLTVVAGNAQFLLEVARTQDLDPALVRSLEDIEEAGRRLQGALGELAAMRQRLAAALASGEGTGDRI